MRGLARLWDDLPTEVREQVVTNYFHIPNEQVALEFVSRRHLAPQAGIPSIPDPEAFFFPVDKFLQQTRLEFREATEAARRHRNREIVAMFEAGSTHKEIAGTFRLSTTTIRNVLRDGPR